MLARGVACALLLLPLPLDDVNDDDRGTVGVVPYICNSPPRLLGRLRPAVDDEERAMSCATWTGCRCGRSGMRARSVGEPRRDSGSSGKKADASDADSCSCSCSCSCSSADE